MLPGNPILIRNPEHWHELRRDHVGGSDCAALFGVNPFISKFKLWNLKKGFLVEPVPVNNDRRYWGTLVEPAIAKGVAEITGLKVRKCKSYWSARPELGLGGTPDYMVNCPERGPGVIEIKAVDSLVFKRWPEDEPPLNYILQLMVYLALTGRSWGMIAALVGGNDLKIFEFERRPETIDLIVAEVKAFWQSIEKNEPTSPEFGRDAASLAELYKTVTPGESVDLTWNDRAIELAAIYQSSQKTEHIAAARKKEARAELLTILKDAEQGILPNGKILSRLVDGQPDKIITKGMVGETIKGKAAYRLLRIYSGETS